MGTLLLNTNKLYFLFLGQFIDLRTFDALGNYTTMSFVHPLLLFFCLYQLLRGKSRVIFLVPLVFFLGGWWASQEFNWGLWWSFDPIEMGGVFLFLNLIVVTHLFSFQKNPSGSAGCLMGHLLLYLFYSYFMPKFTQHSFSVKNSTPGVLYLFLVTAIIWSPGGGVLPRWYSGSLIAYFIAGASFIWFLRMTITGQLLLRQKKSGPKYHSYLWLGVYLVWLDSWSNNANFFPLKKQQEGTNLTFRFFNSQGGLYTDFSGIFFWKPTITAHAEFLEVLHLFF